jgi:hypothetical protein
MQDAIDPEIGAGQQRENGSGNDNSRLGEYW